MLPSPYDFGLAGFFVPGFRTPSALAEISDAPR